MKFFERWKRAGSFPQKQLQPKDGIHIKAMEEWSSDVAQ
jgi:hypothetical protein